MSKPQAGVGRCCLSPYWGVELTGWGYYIERTWRDVHDPLYATAIVIENEETSLAIISLDLMVIDQKLTENVRRQVSEATGIPTHHILVCCTHTHNAPSAGGLLGVGEVDPFYEEWAAKQAATAAIVAWQNRQAALLTVAATECRDLTFNRTRDAGPVDPHLTTLCVSDASGNPLAFVVNFQGHPTVSTVLQPWSVSRDVPGEVCDHLENAFPGSLAMYIQGACGDVNFHRHFSTPERCAQPAKALVVAAIDSLSLSRVLDADQINVATEQVTLPTRRWAREEIENDRSEASQRLQEKDLEGWRDSIGRVMTNRPLEMIDRHGGDEWKAVAAMCQFNMAWTDLMLEDVESRPETLQTEIQAIRIGDLGIVSNSSEFFTTLALECRQQMQAPFQMLACYANGRIGYLPDAHDVQRKTYAAYQSPKYCNQFPFLEESGAVMVPAMAELSNRLL